MKTYIVDLHGHEKPRIHKGDSVTADEKYVRIFRDGRVIAEYQRSLAYGWREEEVADGDPDHPAD